MIHADFGQPKLARILEPAGVGQAGDAEFVIGIDLRRAARGAGRQHDRPEYRPRGSAIRRYRSTSVILSVVSSQLLNQRLALASS